MAEPTAVPTRKVGAGLAAGSLMTIAAWAFKASTGEDIPAAVALAGATVITFLLQYFVADATNPETP
jgi:hypothetical protein